MTVREYIETNIKYPNVIRIKFINEDKIEFDTVELNWDDAHTLGETLEFDSIEKIGNKEFNIVCVVPSMDGIYY